MEVRFEGRMADACLVDVAPCVEGDIPTLIAFEEQMARELGCPADDPRGAYDAEWFAACCRGAFVRDNGHACPARTHVARQGARVVGGIMCFLDRARFSAARGDAGAKRAHKRARAVVQPFLELFWLYVTPAARKARVGAALLAAALSDARRTWADIERVRLHCITTNATGFAFWTRMGFAAGRQLKDYPVDGMCAWRMERPIGEQSVNGARSGAIDARAPASAAPAASSSATAPHARDALPRTIVVCGPCLLYTSPSPRD